MVAVTIVNDADQTKVRLMLGASPSTLAMGYAWRISRWTVAASAVASAGVAGLLRALDLSVVGGMVEVSLQPSGRAAVLIASILGAASFVLASSSPQAFAGYSSEAFTVGKDVIHW